MSEFSDRPLVAGSIVGLRTFRVTPDGVLTGVMHTQARFSPGVNQAECMNLSSYISEAMLRAVRRQLGLPPPQPKPPHQVAVKECTCGYYAYFDGSNDYRAYLALDELFAEGQPRSGFTGIIEGTGVVTVGSRGFRAEKARLVALVAPAAAVQKRPQLPWILAVYVAAMAWDVAAFVGALVGGHPWWATVDASAFGIVGAAEVAS